VMLCITSLIFVAARSLRRFKQHRARPCD
jgi:hypothetical protein